VPAGRSESRARQGPAVTPLPPLAPDPSSPAPVFFRGHRAVRRRHKPYTRSSRTTPEKRRASSRPRGERSSLRTPSSRAIRGARLRRHGPSLRGVGEIRGLTRELAAGLLTGQPLLLVREDISEIHLDPAERRREREAIRPRIEARREVDDRVGTVLHPTEDHLVENRCPHDERPRHPARSAQGAEDLLAAFARERPRVRVAEQRVGPLSPWPGTWPPRARCRIRARSNGSWLVPP
jgi:hypothetical protein